MHPITGKSLKMHRGNASSRMLIDVGMLFQKKGAPEDESHQWRAGRPPVS